MSKPLKDWTLEECRDWCAKQDKCTDNCPISVLCDQRELDPEKWKLDMPKFTGQDIADAKSIKRIFGRDGIVKRHKKAETEPYSNLLFDNFYINEDLFPGIKVGQSITLDEIINQ